MTQNDIVQKLWNLYDVLRDDGINYCDYVTELVLLCARLAHHTLNLSVARINGKPQRPLVYLRVAVR